MSTSLSLMVERVDGVGYLVIRAPTADVGYVPNAKYLAHIPHQTQFKPIYQMWYIVFFFQHCTVP